MKDVARRIISGEEGEFAGSVKGDMGELIRLLSDIKRRTDEISPAVSKSQNELPAMASELNDVNSKTERATANLLKNANIMNDFYKHLSAGAAKLEDGIKKDDKAAYDAASAELIAKVGEASDLGLHILEALEFQDITEQKIRKVIRSIDDVGACIGSIVGYIRVKDSKGKDTKDYDSLLSDLGFA